MKTVAITILCLLTLIGSPKLLAADSGDIPLSDTDGISRLLVSGRHLDIEIDGVEQEGSLHWEHTGNMDTPPSGTRIQVPAMEPVFQRNDDTLLLRLDNNDGNWHLRLQIPVHWEITANVMERGDIHISGQQAAVSAWSARGEVTLTEHSGSFSVTAMDGSAQVDIVAPPAETSAITVWNGELVLKMPPQAETRLVLQESSHLETDLAALQSAKTEKQLRGTAYTLNNGSNEITLRNLNGGIHVLNRDTRP